jgi:hypothetical protein
MTNHHKYGSHEWKQDFSGLITTEQESNLNSGYYNQVARNVGKTDSNIHIYLILMGIVIVVGGVLLAQSLELTAGPLPFPSIKELLFESPSSPFSSLTTTDTGRTVPTDNQMVDKFGIKMMYPTAPGGREWFLDAADPASDGIFNPQGILIWQPDGDGVNLAYANETSGSWQIGGAPTPRQVEKFLGISPSVASSPLSSIVITEEKSRQLEEEQRKIRMEVTTPAGFSEWKNVEITGYVYVTSMLASSDEGQISWYARGGKHSSQVPCDGTALHGRLTVDGRADWQKEIWFTGGYTASTKDIMASTDSILGRWIGWKVVMYNMMNDSAVRMESYIDNNNDNNWVKVTDLVDDGGWFARSTDDVFYSIDCGRPKDYVVTNSGAIATFRSDDITWNFKNLSIREIQPPIQ